MNKFDSKFSPVYVVFKNLYDIEESPTQQPISRELLKAFFKEESANEYISQCIRDGKITKEELDRGWEIEIHITTLELLWYYLETDEIL